MSEFWAESFQFLLVKFQKIVEFTELQILDMGFDKRASRPHLVFESDFLVGDSTLALDK